MTEDAMVKIQIAIEACNALREQTMMLHTLLSGSDAMKVYAAAEMAEAAGSMLTMYIMQQQMEEPSDEELAELLKLVPTPDKEDYDA